MTIVSLQPWSSVSWTSSTSNDPHRSRTYLGALRAAGHGEPVLVEAAGAGWAGSYELMLRDVGETVLARTPDYGGPSFTIDDRGGLGPSVAGQFRDLVDGVMREHGVASEVFVLSPFSEQLVAVADAWRTRREKDVAIADLRINGDERWRRLAKGHRSDITRARRTGDTSCAAADSSNLGRFARKYAEAMSRLGADERWRYDDRFFTALLAGDDAKSWVVEWGDDACGASAVFLVGGRRASYLLAARWGAVSGASAVLWEGFEALSDLGVTEVLLGGGLTTSPDDPLLRFKASFATSLEPLQIGSRAFDAVAHAAAVAAGLARPLPEGAVHA